MIKLKFLNLSIVIWSNILVIVLASTKYEHISSCSTQYQSYSSGIDYIARFECAGSDGEHTIFNTYSKYIVCSQSYLYDGLVEVSFLNCKFRGIERNYFGRFQNLRSFNISDVELEMPEEKDFRNARNLNMVIASNNRLEEISSNLFIDAKELRDVDFSNNTIKRIDPSAFAGANNVQTLNLSYNQIQS